MSKDESELLKRKLQMQCRRGMLELDIFLKGFLDKSFDSLTKQEQADFTELLKSNDQDLFIWLTGREEHADPELNHIVKLIRQIV